MLIVQYAEVFTVSLTLFPKNVLSSYSFSVTRRPTYRATDRSAKWKTSSLSFKCSCYSSYIAKVYCYSSYLHLKTWWTQYLHIRNVCAETDPFQRQYLIKSYLRLNFRTRIFVSNSFILSSAATTFPQFATCNIFAWNYFVHKTETRFIYRFLIDLSGFKRE